MKCLVTGATGHIGNVLVKKLYQAGHRVTALVLPNDLHIEVIKPYCEILHGNILDRDFLLEHVQGYDIVYHLAGIVDIGTGKKKLIYRVNVTGTKNLLEACQKGGVKTLLYTSSVHAIEEKPKGELMSEPFDFDPTNVKGHYAKSKAMASHLVLSQTDHNLKTVIVCPSGVLGPYDYHLSNTGQLFIDVLLGRLTAYVKGSYNFVDVRDVADGIIKASELGQDKDIYLLTGHNITVKTLLDEIAERTGRKKIKTRLARWFILGMSYFAELYYAIRKQKPLFTHYSIMVLGSNHLFTSRKAKKKLGFKTRDILETIQDSLDFAQEHYLTKKGNKWKKKLMQ